MHLDCTDFIPYIGKFSLEITIDGEDLTLPLFAATGEGDYLHLLFKGKKTARLSHNLLLDKSEKYRLLAQSIHDKKAKEKASRIGFVS